MEPSDKLSMDLSLRPVGIVRNKIETPFLTVEEDGIEMHGTPDRVRKEIRKQNQEMSNILIREDLVDILDGIEDYSHLLVFYWAHRVPEQGRSLTRVHPMGRKAFPLVGIFCTCSPARPNPVLMTVVRLMKRHGNLLEVTGLDAVDGSPVLDIKPYVPDFFPRTETRIPEWMQTILGELDEAS